jgi:hypothetical protein
VTPLGIRAACGPWKSKETAGTGNGVSVVESGGIRGGIQYWKGQNAAKIFPDTFSAVSVSVVESGGNYGAILYSEGQNAAKIFPDVEKRKDAEHGQEFTEHMTGGQLQRLPGEHFISLPVHKDWLNLAKLLSDVDTAHLEMRDYGGGGLYGFCVPCAKWLDEKHLASQWHCKKVGRCSVTQVAGACCDVRKRDDDVGVQEYSPKVMHGNIIEFRPRGWKGQQVHGVFLVDSFYYMKDESRGC